MKHRSAILLWAPHLALLALLAAPRWRTTLVLHANHPREIGAERAARLRPLRAAGVTLLNQAVLLAGVNDNETALAGLSDALFDAGVVRVVMGTAAVESPDLVAAVAAIGRVAVGLDLRGDEVAVRGWTAGSGLGLQDALERFSSLGTDAFVITRIERDGTLEGPDLEGLGDALAATGIDVVASGGVGRPGDLTDLADLEVDGRRLAGIIIGRALYEGTVDLAAAVEAMGGR